MKQYIVFSHGQESGPWGTKISSMSKIAEKMQCKVISVDYRGIIDPEDRINKLIQECSSISDPIILVGSSMGGLLQLRLPVKLKQWVCLFWLQHSSWMNLIIH